MNYLAIDIETAVSTTAAENIEKLRPLPEKEPTIQDRWMPETKERVRADWYHPEAVEKRRQDHIAKIRATAGLDPLVGQVVAINYATKDYCWVDVYTRHSEKQMIDRLVSAINEHIHSHDSILTGYNIVGFDLPFLLARSLVNDCRLHCCFRSKDMLYNNRFGHRVIDLMNVWQNGIGRYSSSYNAPKLEALCSLLGIEAKTEIDGKKVTGKDVARFVENNDEQSLLTYCLSEATTLQKLSTRLLTNLLQN